MARVLIVEDEAVLRSSMARGIARLPGIETVEAGTVDEALSLIDRSPPDLIVSDLDLPERSGIELIGEVGKRGLQVRIIFISAYLRAYGAQIPPNANVEVREKPIALDELRHLVREHLARCPETARESAAVRPIIADFLNVASRGGHSLVIEIQREGKPIGRITVAAGELWSARDGEGGGPDAFRRLLAATNARAHCQVLRSDAGERNLSGGWTELCGDEDSTSTAPTESEEDSLGSTGRPVVSSLPTEVDPACGPPVAISADPPTAVSMAAVSSASVTAVPLPVAPTSELVPDEPGGHLETGRAAFQREDYAAALAAFRMAKELGVDDPHLEHHIALAQRLSEDTGGEAAGSRGDPRARQRPATVARASLADSTFSDLRDRALDALLSRRYAEALRELLAADALRPGDPTITANIRRLREMGIQESS